MNRKEREKFARHSERARQAGEAAHAVSLALQPIAETLDGALEQIAGQQVNFCLFVFADGYAQYVANVSDRKTIAAAVRSVIDKWEAGAGPDVPHHLKQ